MLFFSFVSVDDLEEGENQTHRDPFWRLDSIPLCGTWTQLWLILSVLLPKFMRVTVILQGQVVCSLQGHAEKKIAAEHMNAAPIVTKKYG